MTVSLFTLRLSTISSDGGDDTARTQETGVGVGVCVDVGGSEANDRFVVFVAVVNNKQRWRPPGQQRIDVGGVGVRVRVVNDVSGCFVCPYCSCQ